MKNFKDLIVWNKAIELVVSIYKATKEFSKEEQYGLTNQIRRAVVSIPSNIAEGHMRTTNKDFRQFLAIARGSCAELETQILIAYRLSYLNDAVYQDLNTKTEEIAKMLSSLSSKLMG
mgnify:FL=1